MTIDYDVLLLPVFQEMRRLGADVSMAEYLEAIQMLRSGVGLENAETLEACCRLLWAKSQDEQTIFTAVFTHKAAPLLALLIPESHRAGELPEMLDENSSYEEQEPEEAQPESGQPQQGFLAGTASHAAPSLPLSAPVHIPSGRAYHFIPRLPLSKSEMSAHWRQLRRMRPTRPVEEVDIEETIRDICRYGMLRHPIVRRCFGNTAQLVLLVDQGGSMVPFTMLIDALVESVDSFIPKTSIYYFHDSPGQALYEDKHLGWPVPLEQIFPNRSKEYHVLIVSDAGAARAHYDNERLQQTTQFLHMLQDHTSFYAWLNPVSFSRWRFTTAESIELLVPMFPFNRDGLDDVIAILCGHPFPNGVIING